MFLARNATLILLIGLGGIQARLQASMDPPSVPELAATIPVARGSSEENQDLVEVGRALFDSSPTLSCRHCHSIRPGEVGGGPSLAGIGDRLSLEEIAVSVLYPNAQITPGFERQLVATGDGQIIEGRIEFQDHLTVGIRVGSDVMLIPLADLEGIQPLESEMPANSVEGLNTEEFAALVRFLASLRSDSN